MKPRFSLLAVLMLTVTLALVGVLRDVNTGKALIPDPLQPFLADASGGMADTTLGNTVAVNNYTMTVIPRGSRTTLPWIYSGPGWELGIDKELTDGEPLGTVFSYVDALCDSVNIGDSDILEQLPCSGDGPGNIHPLIWNESTTAVETVDGSGSMFLKSLVPPYSWLTRHTANISNICLYGTAEKSTTSILNTVYTSVPFSANGSAFTATTKLGGDPLIPPNSTCLDSPQSSTSITTIYHTPALEGDSDGPCNTTTYECADGAIYGMWTDNTVSLAVGAATTKTVKSVNLDNGPEDGAFSAHWEVELTNSAIMDAGWTAGYAKTADDVTPLTKSASTAQDRTLYLQCLPAQNGEGLVVLKKILWPTGTTKDTYADDNAFVFVVKVICGTGPTNLVDKEVIWVKPVMIVPLSLDPPSPNLESTADHLQLDLGQAITVKIDELKANHHTSSVVGQEWLVAEVADVVKLGVEWDPDSVTIDQGGAPVPVGGVLPCTTGDACIKYEVTEPQGQSDVNADLTITCGAVPGLYSVVLKAIDAPKAPLGEAKPSDNAQRSVIKVWCGLAAMDPDGIEDANGLYVRWTAFQSLGTSSLQIAAELRKSYKSPPSIASDTGYVERLVDLQCFWLDNNGCGPESGLNCLNAIDDDGDGKVNDGCPTQVPETAAQCNDAADAGEESPADGKVNDGCPAVKTAETGAECNNGIDENSLDTAAVGHEDDDGDAVHNEPVDDGDGGKVNDGCQTQAPEILCDNALDDDADGFVNDGCPVAGVVCDGSDITAYGGPASNTGNPNLYIDEMESWNDPDLVALGGINALDEDGDCLMNAALAQPSHPVDELDEPTGDDCDPVPYSEVPNVVVYDEAADQDCDGLVDGIEKAWGSNDQLADSDSDGAPDFVEMFLQTNPLNPDTDGDGLKDRPEDDYAATAAGGAAEPGQEYGSACDDNLDNDADGAFNDGCVKVSAVEAVCNETACPDANGKAPWDTCDNDSDGFINDGCAAVAEGANQDDNCPGVANADQANNDAKRRPNGPVIDGDWASNPNQDKMGDACDSDDDNDFLPDTNEGPAGTNPLTMDFDGDTVVDGAEVIYLTSPLTSAKPTWSAATQQTYFRGCHHNLPELGTYGGIWDAEYDAPPPPYTAGRNGVEMDADGDGYLCGTTDKDSDNGTGLGLTVPPAKVEIEDSVEAFGYGTQIANKDTDGDGCEDWIEMVDLNGSRQANISDVLDFNRRAYDIYPADPVSDVVFDLNRSGSINVADALLAARNSSVLKTHAVCSSEG